MNGCFKTFKVKGGDKDKSNKLVPIRIDDDKLLEKYEAIQTKIEDLKNIELNAVLAQDDGYIKAKIKRYGYKGYTNFRDSNVPEDDIECASFTVILLILYLSTKANITCKYI